MRFYVLKFGTEIWNHEGKSSNSIHLSGQRHECHSFMRTKEQDMRSLVHLKTFIFMTKMSAEDQKCCSGAALLYSTDEVLLANYNMGGFVSTTFMFEISPSGSVAETMPLSESQTANSS